MLSFHKPHQLYAKLIDEGKELHDKELAEERIGALLSGTIFQHLSGENTKKETGGIMLFRQLIFFDEFVLNLGWRKG